MRQLIVANQQISKKYTPTHIQNMIKAQIDNSLDLAWQPEDIILMTNFEYEYRGVKARNKQLNEHCLTGSKMFAIHELLRNGEIGQNEIIWSHDLDAWQNVPFDTAESSMEFADIGICKYSNERLNGGSIFYKSTAADIVAKVVQTITEGQEQKEEPTINKIFKMKEYRGRITILNSTYNVGCSGFVKRYNRAIKPVRVSHFHPLNRIAWDTHVQDRNKLGVISTAPRLIALLQKWFPDAHGPEPRPGPVPVSEPWPKPEPGPEPEPKI